MPPSTARSICLALAPLALILSACSPSPTSTTSAAPARTQEQTMDTSANKPAVSKIKVDQAELRKRLTPEQYEVTQNKGTERAFTGKYWNTHADGTYTCIVCGETLFDSSSKFDSGCGWPSFDKQLGGKIEYHKDTSYGMTRTEVTCAKCGAHLGHVFDDGPTSTGQRYCINSASIDLKEKGEKK